MYAERTACSVERWFMAYFLRDYDDAVGQEVRFVTTFLNHVAYFAEYMNIYGTGMKF